MMPYFRVIPLLLTLSLTACGAHDFNVASSLGLTPGGVTTAPVPVNGTTPPGSGSPSPVGSSPNATFADLVFAQTNAFRANNGVDPVTQNAKLTQSAQAYAESMATLGFFSHTGQDGSDPGTRITAAGYSWMTYGENIAEGQMTPDAVMSAWINSPGHRANLVNGNFKDLGLGYAVAKDGNAYWVQDFGAL